MAQYRLPKRLADKPAKLHEQAEAMFEAAERSYTSMRAETEALLEKHQKAIAGLEKRFETFGKDLTAYTEAVTDAVDREVEELEPLYQFTEHGEQFGPSTTDNEHLIALETAIEAFDDLDSALREKRLDVLDAVGSAPVDYVEVIDD